MNFHLLSENKIANTDTIKSKNPFLFREGFYFTLTLIINSHTQDFEALNSDYLTFPAFPKAITNAFLTRVVLNFR